jgi:putative ABC transport system substrate-binding protein
MSSRRAALGVFAALAAAALTVRGQPRGPRRIGLLLPDEVIVEPPFVAALRDLGYVDGRNATLDRRSARGRFADLPKLADELVRARPDVLVAFLTQATIAAKQATTTIPVVMVAVGNPVESGIVPQLARPGSNVTGTAAPTSAVVGKQLELVRELRPQAKRVATLWNPTNPVYQTQSLDEARAAAARLGLALDLVDVRAPDELDAAFRRIAAARPDAVLVLGEPMLVANARRLGPLLGALRLPAVGGSRAYASEGVIAVYTPDLDEAARRAAQVVDRILRGARPADIPVEVVSTYVLIVNAQVARQLGVPISDGLLARAREVIP